QALAQMRPGVDVVRFPFQRRPVTLLRFVQFALLKINVAKLRMMMRFVQVMDLRLEFLDAATIVRTRQLEATRGGRGGAIYQKEIEQCAQAKSDEDESRPDPLFAPHCI